MKTSNAAILFALVIGCSGSDSNSPGGEPGDTDPVSVLVSMTATGGGSFSATLAGKTYSSSPEFIAVPAGTQELSGSFSGQSLRVSLGGFVGPGGIELSSAQSVEGPSPAVTQCSVTYTRGGAGSSTFRLQFKVNSKTTAHC